MLLISTSMATFSMPTSIDSFTLYKCTHLFPFMQNKLDFWPTHHYIILYYMQNPLNLNLLPTCCHIIFYKSTKSITDTPTNRITNPFLWCWAQKGSFYNLNKFLSNNPCRFGLRCDFSNFLVQKMRMRRPRITGNVCMAWQLCDPSNMHCTWTVQLAQYWSNPSELSLCTKPGWEIKFLQFHNTQTRASK